MKNFLFAFFTFVLFIMTLLINSNIKFSGFIGLFLILPYLIHVINSSLLKKLAKKNFMNHEVKRQLAYFNSNVYKIFMLGATILLGLSLFLIYIFSAVTSDRTIELQNVIFLSMSSVLFFCFVWQFYLEIK